MKRLEMELKKSKSKLLDGIIKNPGCTMEHVRRTDWEGNTMMLEEIRP